MHIGMIRGIGFAGALLLASNTVHAQQTERQEWMDFMLTVLPSAFCDSRQYFRQCFDISADLCVDTARVATRNCLSQYEGRLPAVLQQPRDGQRWGEQIGQCAGLSFETALSDRLKNTALCQDADYWVRQMQR